MGGNALKHLHPVRLTSAQVIELVHHLHRNWQLVDPRPLYLVPWVAEKQDHGDIDLICEAEPATVERFARMVGTAPGAISRNDAVLSVPVPLPWDAARLVQVDFICCASASAATTRFFYAGGDFGMLLGRVAAWQGLVFGMDGLRYRAERDIPWAEDVHLSGDPAEILAALGYPTVLPWFDAYDTLWRFVLSSAQSGPWMFLAEATNHENRSRDKQRSKVVDFQAWLHQHHPDRLIPPAPRRTPAEARAWVRARYPAIDLDGILHLQEARFAHAKLRTRVLGIGAAEDVLGAGQPPELLGEVVRDMQPLLPAKASRDAALGEPAGWNALIAQARQAAATVAARRGLDVRPPPPLPAFVPRP